MASNGSYRDDAGSSEVDEVRAEVFIEEENESKNGGLRAQQDGDFLRPKGEVCFYKISLTMKAAHEMC